MRMFDLDVHKFFIVGILGILFILYLLTSSFAVCIFTAVAIVGALSAQRPKTTALGLNSPPSHVYSTRRKIVSSPEKNASTDSFYNNARQMTPVTPWGISKSNYSPSISNYSERSSVASTPHTPRNASRTNCGFAREVVSSAYNYPPTDQSHYRGLGLFPTIHLHKSPLPILSGKNSTMVHNPVTVRIAPPEKNVTSSPKTDFIFNSKVQTAAATTSTESLNSVLKSLQQIHRKRSFYNATEQPDESQMKRQRRESSFERLSPSVGNTNILNGMRHSTPASTSLCLPRVSRENSPMDLHLGSPRISSCKNNEIFSSYSSVLRSRESMKRRRSERYDNRSIKISKLRNTKNSIFKKSLNEEHRPNTEELKQLEKQTPDSDLEQNCNEDEPNPRKIPKLAPQPIERREGYSKKRELSLYQTLRQTNSLMSQSIPQANSTVEDDHRDQIINQARLHKLLTVFQTKSDDSSLRSRGSNLFSSSPLQVSLGTEANISRSPVSSTGLLTIATIPLTEQMSKPVDSWLPRIDVTTTTTSLTTLSSTGSDRQEVEKIHVSSPPTNNGSTVTSVLPDRNLSQLQSIIESPATTSFLKNSLTAPSVVSVSPLVTASFVSMPLASSTPTFKPLGTNLFPTTPATVNSSLPTQEKPEFTVSLTSSETNRITSATTSSNTFAFDTAPKRELPTIASNFGLQLESAKPSEKAESRNTFQPFQFNATPQTVASGTLQPLAFNIPTTTQKSLNPINEAWSFKPRTSTTESSTTGGFTFNLNSATTAAPSTPVFSINTSFGQTATTSAFNVNNSSGVYNFGAAPAVNGPSVLPTFGSTALTTSGATSTGTGPATQFTFGQGGGYSFNFNPEPTSVGVTNRKAVQARRRTSRQH